MQGIAKLLKWSFIESILIDLTSKSLSARKRRSSKLMMTSTLLFDDNSVDTFFLSRDLENSSKPASNSRRA